MTIESASPISHWSLQLDDEGFPIMDGGIRGDEEEFLKLVFQNLKRLDGSDKRPLATRMDDKDIIVTSFDDPLIAQEVVSLSKDELQWKFLGGLQYNVLLRDLRVDEWNRLHAYVGPEKIPAVMSRKTQADFLLKFQDLPSLAPKAFRGENVSDEVWKKHYEHNDIPWDMGQANPVFVSHSQRMVKESGATWLIPGAGTGYEITLLEKAGKKVTALDLSPLARDNFFKLNPKSPCEYLVADFFKAPLPSFDAILENYFFVALTPLMRKATLARIHQLLKPGAFYGGTFFTRFAEGGPPFGLSEWELKTHIDPLFEIVEWQRSPNSLSKRSFMELWVLLRKK